MSMMIDHLRTMARYNKWANGRLSAAVMALSEEDYLAERGAFFGSIHGALNHLLLVDRLWRGRIVNKPYPAHSLTDTVADDRETLVQLRTGEDDIIIALTDSFDAEGLAQKISYKSIVGFSASDNVSIILAHMFNHATHHRGQVHGLLSQVPSDPPPLDLMIYLRDIETA